MGDSVAAVVPAELENEGRALERALRERGVRLRRVGSLGAEPGIQLVLEAESERVVGSEGYLVQVDPGKVRIAGAKAAGVFYGVQTFRQMLIGRGVAPFDVPSARIVDKPRFGWRGMHLDVSRHFFTAAEIKRFLDYISELKFNVFHWHLVDDGGWRMESKKYPLLTDRGAWRKDISNIVWSYTDLVFPGRDSGMKLEGGFYTQDEIRDVVRYAAERHITVVPEIEMPGHCLPAMECYPQLGCDIEKRPQDAFRTNVFCAGKESTMQFIRDILDETLELFPSKVIHIGGDEVDKGYWTRCPACNATMKQKGLKDYHELQSDFIKRAEVYLNSKGRTLIGWDEILEGGLAPNAMVMSWRGTEGGIAAAKSGHEVVMSPTSHCYFDYAYTTTSTEHVYGYEPVPAELNTEQGKLVRGAQANIWTEWIPDFDRVETMAFPRMLAMAEVLWTPRERRYYPAFERRLSAHYPEFMRRGIDFYVGRPEFEANLIVFDRECEVALGGPTVPGIALRYTLDGRDPDGSSPTLSGPLRLDRNAVVTAAYMKGGKVLDAPVRATVMRGAPKGPARPGLEAAIFVRRFNSVAEVDKAAGSRRPIAANGFEIAPYVSEEAFALRWTGFLHIEKEGLYTFTLGSDDGSRLRIAGATVVDNDGLHAFLLKSGKARLLPGDYPFEIVFFEAGGAERFEAWVEGPGFGRRNLADLVVR